MLSTHGVEPGHSWGSLSADGRARWEAMECDRVLANNGDGAGAGADAGASAGAGVGSSHGRESVGDGKGSDAQPGQGGEEGGAVGALARRRHFWHRKRKHRLAAEKAAAAADGTSARSPAEQCAHMREHYGVRPGTSWGSLSTAGQRRWVRLRCDSLDPEQERKRSVEATYLREYAARLREALASRPPRRRIGRSPPPPEGVATNRTGTGEDTGNASAGAAAGGGAMARAAVASPPPPSQWVANGSAARRGAGSVNATTVVSICVCTTSRHTDATELGQLALFSIMLPSLRDTLAARMPPPAGRPAASGAATGRGAETTSLGARISQWFATATSSSSSSSAASAASADTNSAGAAAAVDAPAAEAASGEPASAEAQAAASEPPQQEEMAAAAEPEPEPGPAFAGTSAATTAAVRAAELAHHPGAFEYWLYVLYDAGDPFFDSASREAEVVAWIAAELVGPLKAAGVTLRFALLRFDNVLHKPGPAFNFMMRAAYDDGADYLYRVNDDTQFVGAGWVAQAVGTLRSYEPPNVGVVGPICHEGNTRILTHDLVHRSHLDIFEHYYPPIFSDWWMDDWITHVYGPGRTRRGPFQVHHRIGHQGTRYEVDQSHESRLQSELQGGKLRIARWLLSRGDHVLDDAISQTTAAESTAS